MEHITRKDKVEELLEGILQQFKILNSTLKQPKPATVTPEVEKLMSVASGILGKYETR